MKVGELNLSARARTVLGQQNVLDDDAAEYFASVRCTADKTVPVDQRFVWRRKILGHMRGMGPRTLAEILTELQRVGLAMSCGCPGQHGPSASTPTPAPPEPPPSDRTPPPASPDQVRLRVVNAGLVDVPIYETNRRARNWACVLSANPNAPGGMDRRFWTKARGDLYYVVPPDLHVYDPVEFGADYFSYSGTRYPKRWCGVLVEVTPAALVLVHAATSLAAVMLAEEMRDVRVGGAQ